MDMYEEYKRRVRELSQELEASSAEEGMTTLDAFVKDYEESLCMILLTLFRTMKKYSA